MNRPLTVALLHPELGFGGSERLMLDAALELTARGHRAPIFTARFDPRRAFDDASNPQLDVRVRRVKWPFEIGGHARVLCAVRRMAELASIARAEIGRVDAVLCDLVPHAVSSIRARSGAPVVFYCHYPDSLLARQGGAAYQIYRRAVDAAERRGMRASARIIVNSHFTDSALRRAVPGLDVPSDVINPGVAVELFAGIPALEEHVFSDSEIVLLSVGRFHPDKNHALAIETMAALRTRVAADVFARLRLVIAGGFDSAVPESVDVADSLSSLSHARGLNDVVTLVRSPTDRERLAMLARASIVLHTAPAEHFGIAPIEAMSAARPVVAVNHAGPAETVRHDVTGLLVAATANAFADAVAGLLADPAGAARMGVRGRAHAIEHYSRALFGARLEAAVIAAATRGGQQSSAANP